MTTVDDLGPLHVVTAIDAILAPLTRAVADPTTGPPAGPEGSWTYVLTKVLRYLELGPHAYRQTDAFGQPPADWGADQLDALRAGMEQFGGGKGLVRQAPLQGLDVPAVHDLMHVLHFGLEHVKTVRTPDRRFLDRMRFRHALMPAEFVVVYAAFAPDGGKTVAGEGDERQ